MRALVGALITAGALIGLGLACLGVGVRYQGVVRNHPTQTDRLYDVKFFELDNALQFGLVFLTMMAVIGLTIAFIGLAYHHERRYREAHLGPRGTDAVSVPE
jgi:hypothetical protein